MPRVQQLEHLALADPQLLVAVAVRGTARELPPAVEAPHPPIALHFTLPEPGYVTLVIDDAQDQRVCNVVSETLFPAGQNTAWAFVDGKMVHTKNDGTALKIHYRIMAVMVKKDGGWKWKVFSGSIPRGE